MRLKLFLLGLLVLVFVLVVAFAGAIDFSSIKTTSVVNTVEITPEQIAKTHAEEGKSLKEIYVIVGNMEIASRAYFRVHTNSDKLITFHRNFGKNYLRYFKMAYDSKPSLNKVYKIGNYKRVALVRYSKIYGEPTMEQLWELKDKKGKWLTWKGLTVHQELFNKRNKSQLIKGQFKKKSYCDNYYRPYVKFIFSRYGIATEGNIRKCLNSIWGESKGNPKITGGQHKGLMQFNNGWAGGNKKYNGFWSIRRVAKCIDVQGESGWRKHWIATCYG